MNKIAIIRSLVSVALLGACLTVSGSAAAAENLVENGAMETIAQELPGGWELLSIGAPARLSVDTSEKHGGKASVRLDAPEVTRSYARSVKPIEVAPGEMVEASAWVKFRDVPTSFGTVILIAEFANARGEHVSVAKFDTAFTKQPTDKWQQISGSVKVPDNASRLHLRMGFSYSKGTCWWDDVTVTAKQPLACRVELPEGRLSPAMKRLPVTVLNRDGRKDAVSLKVMLNKRETGGSTTLSGEPVQRLAVAIGPVKPGKVAVEAAIVGADGKAVFTNTQNAIVPPPLTLGVPSPTHWAAEDGQPVVEGLIDLAVTDEARQGATLSIQLLDAEGNFSGEWRPGGGNPKNGRDEFVLKAGRAPIGDYKLVATFTPTKGKPLTAEQPWQVITRQQAKVTLNPRGYPEYQGKAIFPLGIFNGGKFTEQAEAGFTVTHAYNAVRLEEDPANADEKARRWIDTTHSLGMKMLFMVPMKAVIHGDWDAVRRRVRMFRNHPGLLAWDEEEGFARGDFKPDTLKTLRQIVAEEDPHHPFMVGDSRDVIGRMPSDRSDFFPVEEMDLGMWWWYPFPLKEREGDALLGEDAGPPGLELVPPAFLVNARTRKPLWVGVQCYKKPGDDSRYPTPEEYRVQAYLALIHGARGLMWYGGSVTGGLFLSPEEGRWDELKKVVRELRDQSELFMSPSEKPPEMEPRDAPVSAMIKRTPKGRVLVAANRSAKVAEATIEGRIVTLRAYEVVVTELR